MSSENANFKPQGLHHIEIYVSDLEKSKQFWSWFLGLLGYEAFQSWDQGFSFIYGNTYIVFVQTLKQHLTPEYHRCRTGLNHLAFWAASAEQIAEVTVLLKARGVEILYEDRHPYPGGSDYPSVFFEDPDRIKVELVAPL
ncbi:MAG: VOC family protein [Candidatus Marinimicrobia bacterium]|nr:VOC family protein [Candidatus Neomarinimicrobiota bacterium]